MFDSFNGYSLLQELKWRMENRKTMGQKIKVTLEGVAAETAGALTLYFTEHFKSS
jgi:hypothetical protein